MPGKKKEKGKKTLTCSQAVPQGIGIRRKNLIPNDTKILPLLLRQKGQRFKEASKNCERQPPFLPCETVFRKELLFPNSDFQWGRAWK